MENEWRNYHEPLARIYREVRKGMPDFQEAEYTASDIIQDDEVKPEIQLLIEMMLEEIENES